MPDGKLTSSGMDTAQIGYTTRIGYTNRGRIHDPKGPSQLPRLEVRYQAITLGREQGGVEESSPGSFNSGRIEPSPIS